MTWWMWGALAGVAVVLSLTHPKGAAEADDQAPPLRDIPPPGGSDGHGNFVDPENWRAQP